MSLDLQRALRDVVDGAPDDPGVLGGPAGLASLRTRVRRRRAARAATRTAVGTGAACAVGLGALAVQHDGGASAPLPAAGPAAAGSSPGWSATPAPTRAPVAPSESALCGLSVDELTDEPGGVDVSLGMPGLEVDAGDLVGRSLGDEVPVWLDVAADAGSAVPTEHLVGAEIVVVGDDAVVAVADGGATVVSVDEATSAMLRATQQGATGTGTLRACPGTGPDGLAGAVPPAGEYTLRAVAELEPAAGGAARRAVSQPVPVTLLPEQAPVAAGAANLPEDFPLDAVPLVGTRVLGAVTAGIGGWKVTVEVEGTDALQRAADALGMPQGPTTSWQRLGGGDAELTLVQTEAAAAAARAAGIRASASADLWAGSGFTEWGGGPDRISARGRGVGIEVQEQPGPGGVNTLVYRVTRG